MDSRGKGRGGRNTQGTVSSYGKDCVEVAVKKRRMTLEKRGAGVV